MAKTEKEEEKTENESGEATPPPKKSNMLLFIIIGVVVLLLAGGGAAFFLLGHKKTQEKVEEKPKEIKQMMYLKIPDLLVTLNATEGKRQQFLKMGISLEVENKQTLEHLEMIKPRLIDQFQLYLRTLRLEDLSPEPSRSAGFKGSAGIERVREDLLVRANAIAAPFKVNNVLFDGNMILQ